MALCLAALLCRVSGQIAVPTSHPGNLPGQPTSSMLLGDHLSAYQGWWASPENPTQAGWKSDIIANADQSVAFSQPGDFGASVAQARIVQAKALRWQLDPSATSAAADKAAVINVLSNYAAVTGGTSITSSEVVQSYYQAFDFISGGLSAIERASITSRLSGSNVKGTITGFPNEPFQVNNQQLKHASTRALGALLFNDDSDLDAQLNRINESLSSNTTNDGAYTDAQNHYFNYATAQFAPFLVAYRNHADINLGSNIEPLVTMSLGIRLPNGTTPNLHNGVNAPIAVHQYGQLLASPALKAAVAWNATELGTHNWGGSTNILNNDGTYTDFFTLADFSVASTAPTVSPTYFSRGQANVAVFRNDWGVASNYLALVAGIDGKQVGFFDAGFHQSDTGDLFLAANGTNVLVAPGYNRTGLSNTPTGFDSSRATEHNVVLARDTGTTAWGIGAGDRETNTSNTTNMTNRLDSTERGGSKGVGDFASLDFTHGISASAGANVSRRRDIAHPNESYFVVADTFSRTDVTNKDFAFNLIGKGVMSVLTNTPTYKSVKWEVTNYGTFNNNATIGGFPYDQPQSGQVIEHLVSGHAMTLATDTTWMHENYNLYQQTQRMRATITNVPAGNFLSILEAGATGVPSALSITNYSTAEYAAAKASNALEGWSDIILSQAGSGSRTVDRLGSDARYANVRYVGDGVESLMIAEGTTISDNGLPVLLANNRITLSLLLTEDGSNIVRGNISADNFVANTSLQLYRGGDLISATLDGNAIPFTNSAAFDTVTLPGGGELVLAYVPEPAACFLLTFGALLSFRRQRQE